MHYPPWLRWNDTFFVPGLDSNWLWLVNLSVEFRWRVCTWSISGQQDAWRLSLGLMEGKFLRYFMELPRWYTMTHVVISVNMGKACPSVKVAQLGASRTGMTKPEARPTARLQFCKSMNSSSSLLFLLSIFYLGFLWLVKIATDTLFYVHSVMLFVPALTFILINHS